MLNYYTGGDRLRLRCSLVIRLRYYYYIIYYLYYDGRYAPIYVLTIFTVYIIIRVEILKP